MMIGKKVTPEVRKKILDLKDRGNQLGIMNRPGQSKLRLEPTNHIATKDLNGLNIHFNGQAERVQVNSYKVVEQKEIFDVSMARKVLGELVKGNLKTDSPSFLIEGNSRR